MMISDRKVTWSVEFVDFEVHLFLISGLGFRYWMVVGGLLLIQVVTISDRHKLHKIPISFECLVDKIYGDYQ
jgi:hypothetical protein